MRLIRHGWVLALTMGVALLAPESTAFSQDSGPTLVEHYASRANAVRGKRILQRGALRRLRGRKISIAGRKSVAVGTVADDLFKEQRALRAELRRGRGALLADPVEDDVLLETDDATVLATTTRFTVVSPDTLRSRSARFKKLRAKNGRGGWKFSKLSASGRAEFAAFKARAKRYPPRHPLRKAADKGDEALIDAVIAGQGDFEVTTTIVIPKRPLIRDSAGNVLVPVSASNGTFDYGGATQRIASKIGRGGTRNANISVEEKPSKTNSRGAVTHTAKFVTGFTEADTFVWERTWKFPSGYLRVRAKAWYEFGLRVPVEIKGVMTPGKITYRASEDKKHEFEVALSAKALDASAGFYEAVGMDKSLIKKGKEFVLGAGFEVLIDVKAGFIIKKKITIPKNANFDFGSNFTPPFGGCGSSCGFDIWIPSNVTHTGIGIMGIVTGSAQVGFKIGGDGALSVKAQALSGDGPVKSWRRGGKRDASWFQKLEFSSGKQVIKVKAEAVKHKRDGVTKTFGYSLTDPEYHWNVKLTPGVKATLSIKAKPIINQTFVIGPLWLNTLAIDLGTIKLVRHKGTVNKYKVKKGEKTFYKRN